MSSAPPTVWRPPVDHTLFRAFHYDGPSPSGPSKAKKRSVRRQKLIAFRQAALDLYLEPEIVWRRSASLYSTQFRVANKLFSEHRSWLDPQYVNIDALNILETQDVLSEVLVRSPEPRVDDSSANMEVDAKTVLDLSQIVEGFAKESSEVSPEAGEPENYEKVDSQVQLVASSSRVTDSSSNMSVGAKAVQEIGQIVEGCAEEPSEVFPEAPEPKNNEKHNLNVQLFASSSHVKDPSLQVAGPSSSAHVVSKACGNLVCVCFVDNVDAVSFPMSGLRWVAGKGNEGEYSLGSELAQRYAFPISHLLDVPRIVTDRYYEEPEFFGGPSTGPDGGEFHMCCADDVGDQCVPVLFVTVCMSEVRIGDHLNLDGKVRMEGWLRLSAQGSELTASKLSLRRVCGAERGSILQTFSKEQERKTRETPFVLNICSDWVNNMNAYVDQYTILVEGILVFKEKVMGRQWYHITVHDALLLLAFQMGEIGAQGAMKTSRLDPDTVERIFHKCEELDDNDELVDNGPAFSFHNLVEELQMEELASTP